MFATIVSVNNPRVKSATQLRESRIRRQRGLFLIDGLREATRAWRCGFRFDSLFWDAGSSAVADQRPDVFQTLSATGRDPARIQEIVELTAQCEARGVHVIPLRTDAFTKIGFGDRNEGVIAVAHTQTTELSQLETVLNERSKDSGQAPLLGVIEGVEKPGNVGAIIRSGDGAGIHALLIATERFDVFNPNVIRASLGAIFHMPIVVDSSENIVAWLRRYKVQRATALCDEALQFHQLDYRRPTAIILGSEAYGLTDLWAQETSEDKQFDLLKKIRLPMLGIADSLNVSNAAAVLFYQARCARDYHMK
ncbi:MAG: TrmH family RNA methyltransferase [Planctomycetia bacterium]|nr:TrmH family RNA methyltransferase [Planctomycetia bacterium]